MKAFSKEGGRLLKIGLIFALICVGVILIQSYFLREAMAQVYLITTMTLEEGTVRPQVPVFYSTIIPALSPDRIVTALSALLIAIAARYGAREATKNIAEGQRYKLEMKMNGAGAVETSEEVER